MATRYAYSIDLDRCIGCQACTVACKTGNEVSLTDAYITVTDIVRGQSPNFFGSFAHHRCFHCGDAPCVSVCPTSTLTKWNGLTIVEPEKCSACGYCTDACPFKVPHLFENHVSKCIACLELVKDGGTPWCATTCPSQALKFGEREKILADAKARIAQIKSRYPNAQVYGETQLGGLGLLMILLDKPGVYGLPEDPRIPVTLTAWQKVVQPASVGLTLATVAVTGLSFIFARRQHAREKMETLPVEELPVEVSPVEELPVEELPVEELPVEVSPVEVSPVEELPVEELPVEELPVEVSPVEALPVEESPVEALPVEELHATSLPDATSQPAAKEEKQNG